jgi:hypothetical protein
LKEHPHPSSQPQQLGLRCREHIDAERAHHADVRRKETGGEPQQRALAGA